MRVLRLPSLVLASLSLVACGDASPVVAAADASTPTDAPVVIDVPVAVDVPVVVDAPAPVVPHWASLPVTDGPTGRWGVMVAERGDGTAWLYGGTTLTAAGRGAVSHDIWRYDGRGDAPAFELLSVTGNPPPRYCGCLAYDPMGDRILMVGGRTPDVSAPETWTLDLGTLVWTRAVTTGSPPGTIGCAMAWSASRNAMYLVGGASETGVNGRTWRFDPSGPGWQEVMATGPRARYDHALRALDGGRSLVLFGGARSATGATNFFNDLWRFDTSTEQWTQVMVDGPSPAGRRTPWMVVEADGAHLLMGLGVHGLQVSETFNDLWRLDLGASRWTELTADAAPTDGSEGPPARGFTQGLPGPRGSLGLLLGGFDGRAPVDDAWVLR
jgi:hypothetical protein